MAASRREDSAVELSLLSEHSMDYMEKIAESSLVDFLPGRDAMDLFYKGILAHLFSEFEKVTSDKSTFLDLSQTLEMYFDSDDVISNIENAIAHVDKHFLLFEEAVSLFKQYSIDLPYDRNAISNALLARLEYCFSNIYVASSCSAVKKCVRDNVFFVTDQALVSVVIPRVIAAQAQRFLKERSEHLSKHFVILDELFQSTDCAEKLEKIQMQHGKIWLKEKDYPSYFINTVSVSLFKPDNEKCMPCHFVAACGPHMEGDVASLFDNTVFHSQKPIRHFVAIVDVFKRSLTNERYDILNYFFGEVGDKYRLGQYEVEIKRVQYECVNQSAYLKLFNAHDENNDLRDLNKYVAFTLHIRNDWGITKELTVHFFKTQDGKSIDINRFDDFIMFDRLIHLSQKEPILVHCAAGLGRTGTFIFTCILSVYWNQVFSNNIKNTAKNMLNLLADIRKFRPGLILERNQLKQAMVDAFRLYQHRQDQQKLHNDFGEGVSLKNLSLFAQEKLESVQKELLDRENKGFEYAI